MDIEGRVYADSGNLLHHYEEGAEHYFTHIPDESIEVRLSRFKKYQVFSYGNDLSSRFFIRYLNCLMLHMRYVSITQEESLEGAESEIKQCYMPLVAAGVKICYNG